MECVVEASISGQHRRHEQSTNSGLDDAVTVKMTVRNARKQGNGQKSKQFPKLSSKLVKKLQFSCFEL